MTLVFVLSFALLILAGVALSYSRLMGTDQRDLVEESWWLEFDPSRYTVLTRLASAEDLRVARGWRGINAELEKRIRRERMRAAAAYLKEMRADFLRLETAGRMMVLAGNTSVEFRQTLVEAKFRFSLLWWQVRLQFALAHLGVGRVNAAKLVEAFDRFVAVAGPLNAAPAEV